MSSSSSIFCFFLFSSLILFRVGVHGVGLIEETCKKAVNPDLKYEFCVSALQSDPKSQTADIHGLGLISMGLAVKNATSISSNIKGLLPTAKPEVKKYLEDCLEFYSDSVSVANEAIQAFQSKDYPTANIKISAALDVSTNCEDGFNEEPGLTSPISKEDDNFLELTSMSLAIINMIPQ